MQNSKLLNFVDAMNLAKTLEKYQIETWDMEMPYEDFISNLLLKVELEDLNTLFILTLGEDYQKMEQREVFVAVAESFVSNKFLDIFGFYKSLRGK